MGLFGKKLEADAVILQDEGSGKMMETDSHGVDWEWHTYVIEVRPAGEQPFRAESKTKVAFFSQPNQGDTVRVTYDPKHHRADILIEGDPRYDPKVKRDKAREQKEADKERAKALLAGHDLGPAASNPYDDPEIAELEMLERMEKLEAKARIPDKCPECGARIDQGEAAAADHPACPFCHKPLPVG